MKLYLEKRGCDFFEKELHQQSDLENYRLFLEFIDKDGKRICGDVGRGAIRSGELKRGKPVIISENGLYTHFQYENYTGCYCYHTDIGCAGEYTQENVLKLVNSLSAVTYDSIEIVDRLPEAAHEYPESALELERAYLADDHAAMVRDAEEKIRESYTRWCRGLELTFRKMAPEEYRHCTLIAFQAMAEALGIIKEAPSKPTGSGWAARQMSRHFFEEQKFVDPYEDQMLLSELEKLAPVYVGKYIPAMTPEEFAATIQ